MDLYNLFKSFLGLPNSVPPHDFTSDRYKNYPQDDDNVFRANPEEDDSMYQLFSSPAEMQRFFEQQINDIINSFGLSSEGSFFGSVGTQTPAIEGPNVNEHKSDNLRDQYLKKGYETPNINKPKADCDVDGRADLKDLDAILSNKNDDNGITPYQRPSQQRNIFFGQSISSKTIQNADGTIEIHRTVKDNLGNEEKTVTYKKGEQEYTVITKTDKAGKQEKEEKYLNIDENDIQKFVTKTQPGLPPEFPQNPNWFNFDKYFK